MSGQAQEEIERADYLRKYPTRLLRFLHWLGIVDEERVGEK